MIHFFCCVSGLHHKASLLLGVCERGEAVSEDRERELRLGCRLHHVHLFALTFLDVFAFVCIVVRVVVCTSFWSPAIFDPVSRSTTVLASVDVCVACVACASTFLVWGVFLFLFPLPSGESPPASNCHHQHLFRSMLMLSRMVQNRGKKCAIATERFEELYCRHM